MMTAMSQERLRRSFNGCDKRERLLSRCVRLSGLEVAEGKRDGFCSGECLFVPRCCCGELSELNVLRESASLFCSDRELVKLFHGMIMISACWYLRLLHCWALSTTLFSNVRFSLLPLVVCKLVSLVF